MTQKKITTRMITIMALSIGINFLGGTIALWLRLPIYLDSIGTIFAGALLGPIPGILTGLSSSLLSGVTMDMFSLYYSPIQIITGLLAGLILPQKLQAQGLKSKLSLFAWTFVLSAPGTILSSIITIQLFGGITSSGSSTIVQLLYGLGLNQAVSVTIVQAATDYLDRLLSVLVVSLVVLKLPNQVVAKTRNR
ncbi:MULTISPECIES: ECF transporter S component [Enterococcus]|uniref:Integral membrane protein n=1 Tax=Enterococcus mundtii TaxID=53346 RepID=A0AAI8R801_ENTMU|nr:ECF transporter S component [Enterococcus mundtii]MBE9909706.1 ECF transporter S component [Enterococcus mundtii]MCA6772945.1 ECF transporter S component [Enterococcus mundtii]MRI73920.1 ECF transporter S component [Enterococcus mundtii]PJK26806.1 ECF transporter S component [Enterococcus mundtii]QCJ56932.1 ECF transporter S component [Enterococcus mundtii]